MDTQQCREISVSSLVVLCITQLCYTSNKSGYISLWLCCVLPNYVILVTSQDMFCEVLEINTYLNIVSVFIISIIVISVYIF